MQNAPPLVFRPRRPNNRRAGLLTALFLVPYLLITAMLWQMSLWVALPWTIVLVLCLAVMLPLLFLSAHAVSYTLEADSLVLRYGKLVEYRLPYQAIRTVRPYTLTRREPIPLQGNSAQLPGLDTSAYHTPDAGNIKLLATGSPGPLVLIEAEGGNYGITPQDEEGFLTALRRQIRAQEYGWPGDSRP
jgi:hypothetical protein